MQFAAGFAVGVWAAVATIAFFASELEPRGYQRHVRIIACVFWPVGLVYVLIRMGRRWGG